ncbi:MAG: hypothetical protein L6R40_002554 [Gallowayella cf. fulva]|nr:MAG: hypothetical protein L6R40_002554 [Xanthomendoza cf. fulva]
MPFPISGTYLASQENEFHYAISIKNRTIPPTHISGQAIQGLMTQAMWDLAQKPRNKVLDDSYSYTASYPTGVPFKYTVSIGVKPTSQSERGLWEVTNANLMDGLYVVSALYSIQADVNALDEWSFDFIVLDPWRSRNATIIAKGSIAQPPKPLGKPVSGVATA